MRDRAPGWGRMDVWQCVMWACCKVRARQCDISFVDNAAVFTVSEVRLDAEDGSRVGMLLPRSRVSVPLVCALTIRLPSNSTLAGS